MPETELRNIQTYHAAILIKELAARGLEHAIISPGSRSTPLALAFAVHPFIKSHIVIDERSAAFIALGIAKASGKPAALVCTSGTAVANYFPAVAEAQRSGVPMIILSADRDFNETNTGANQWIDQNNLFGNKAVFFAQVSPRENDKRDQSRLSYLAHQAWSEAIHKGGCAHLNFPFRKPLEPTDDFLSELSDFYSSDTESPYTISNPESTFSLDAEILRQISESKSPIIISTLGIDASNVPNIVKFIAQAGIPVIAEAGAFGFELSGLDSFIDGANTFLRDTKVCASLAPDLIIRFGDEPIGKGVLTYLKMYKDVPTIRFTQRLSWTNSTFSPENTIILHKRSVFDVSIQSVTNFPTDWINSWRHYESQVLFRKKSIPNEKDKLRDGDLYEVLSELLSPDEILFVSNSFPARDIDSFGNKKLKSRYIYMNRGASGIDGIISTSIGVAISTSGSVTLIIGDLAFVHDLTALIALKNLGTRVRIIVINNNGGGIFEMLPVADSNHFDTYFRTSQHVDVNALAIAAGLTSTKVSSVQALTDVLSSEQNYQVIECITDQKLSMDQRKALWG